jgi:hypothetical protein
MTAAIAFPTPSAPNAGGGFIHPRLNDRRET